MDRAWFLYKRMDKMNKNLKKLVNIRAKAGGIDNRYRTDMTNNGFTSIPISESTAPPPHK